MTAHTPATDEEIKATLKLISMGYLTPQTSTALIPFLDRIEADSGIIKDLLAACKEALEWMSDDDPKWEPRLIVERAIAKAEGKDA